MQGNRRCSGAWWAISIEDGVPVHWHANVCVLAIYSPQAHLHSSHLYLSWGSVGRLGPGPSGGYGPTDTVLTTIAHQVQEGVWPTSMQALH